MERLLDAIEASFRAGRTPLVLDHTAPAGSSGFTPLETYYFYSGDHLLELKRMVVEVNISKEKTTAEVLHDARARLVRAIKYGGFLVYLLSTSAPRIRSQFSSPTDLPFDLLSDCTAVRAARGAGGEWKALPWARALLTDADEVHAVHDDFGVVAVTRFAEEEAVEFLADELPLEHMQFIRVTTAASAGAPKAAAAAPEGP